MHVVIHQNRACVAAISSKKKKKYILHSDGSNINVDDKQSMTLKVHWIQAATQREVLILQVINFSLMVIIQESLHVRNS